MFNAEEFATKIISPSKDGNPVVMWFWNGEINEADIRKFIAAFKEQGIYEFFIHPMYDLGMEYLSPRFFELIKFAVFEAKRLKMKYWIYDEYNWPSGIAGGKVLKDGDAYRSKVLSRISKGVKGGERFSATVEKFAAAHFRCAEGMKDVTAEVKVEAAENGDRVTFENRYGDGTLFVTYRHLQQKVGSNAMWSKYASYEGGYVDVFNPEAIDKFIKYTYEAYKKAVGFEFGKTVRGIFNDEPAFTDFDDTSKGQIAWSERFPEQFRAINGYDILPKIYLLFENNETEEEIALKRDYRDTLGKLFRENYISRVSGWAKKNGLEFTAHLLGEEFLTAHTEQFGSFLETERLFTVPAIDSVFSGEFVDKERFNVSAAMLDSTAHWLGKKKTLCETYTGSGWELTLSDMKRIAHRLMMQGVTTMMFMGAYHCLEGMKKFFLQCYPPSHGPNNVLFNDYGVLSDYFTRLSAIVANSVKKAGVLLLYPSTTAAVTSKANYIHTWEYSIKDFHDKTTYRQMDAAVTATINALIAEKVTFEVAFEELFEKATVNNGTITFDLGHGAAGPYDTVILPAVRFTRAKTAEVLRQFISEGGKTVFVNDLPEKEIDGFTPFEIAGETAGFKEACVRVKARPDDKETAYFEIARNIRGVATNEVSIEERNAPRAALSKALKTLMHEEKVSVTGGDDIMCFARETGPVGVYLIANDSLESEKLRIDLHEDKKAIVFDLDEGVVTGSFNRSYETTLCGREGIVVFAGDIDTVSELEKCLESGKKLIAGEHKELIGNMTFSAESGNTLRLGYEICVNTAPLAGKKPKEVYAAVCDMPRTDFKKEKDKYNKPEGNGWVISDLERGKPFALRSYFTVINKPKKLELVCEDIFGSVYILNGKPLKLGRHETVYDRTNVVFDVSQTVSEGTNILVVMGNTPDYDMPFTPPFSMIRGDFALDERCAVVSPVREGVGEFTSAGYPFYSGVAVYEFSKRFDKKEALLELETRDYAAVFVNSSFVGEKAWPPYLFDLSGHLRKGENDVKIYVTPTMANLFDRTVESGIKKAYIVDKKKD